nr:uncharacterized protein LOC117995713 [Maniola hyperantus]
MAGQVIVDEFLCFVQNKIDILDELSIIQICATNYTDVEIETGKSTLYSVCTHDLRNIHRKGDDKKKKCIKDVIKLLKEVDPKSLPNFVARDLSRLPPVSFDYVDVTRLLKDMSIMKTELMELKTQFITELKEIRTSCQERNESTPRVSVSPERTNSTSPSKTLQPVAVPSPTRTQANGAETVHTPSYRDIVFNSNHPRRATSARMQGMRSGQTGLAPTTNLVAASDASSKITELPPENKTDSFTVVVNKKRKSKNMRGTSDTECRIQVADSQCSIYVSRAKKSVTVNDILEHISDRGEQCISVEQLKQNKETSFNSFKITIPASRLGTFLDGKFWPAGLVFRRYKERFTNTATKHTRL